MEQANKIIIHERQMIGEAYQKEIKAIKEDDRFSMYHEEMANQYERLLQCIDGIVNFQGRNDEDFIIYFANMPISKKQVIELNQLRQNALYKRALGEVSLSRKEEIESILNYEITNNGIVTYNKGNAIRAIKIPQELAEEGNIIKEKLENLSPEKEELKLERLKRNIVLYIIEYRN